MSGLGQYSNAALCYFIRPADTPPPTTGAAGAVSFFNRFRLMIDSLFFVDRALAMLNCMPLLRKLLVLMTRLILKSYRI